MCSAGRKTSNMQTCSYAADLDAPVSTTSASLHLVADCVPVRGSACASRSRGKLALTHPLCCHTPLDLFMPTYGSVPKYPLLGFTYTLIMYACLVISCFYRCLSDAQTRFIPRCSDAVYVTGILARTHVRFKQTLGKRFLYMLPSKVVLHGLVLRFT